MSHSSSVVSSVSPVDAIRAQFPALRREHRGYPVAYFDGPGGTQVPDRGCRSHARLPVAPQREHPLGVSHERGDRRGDRGRAGRAGRLPRRLAGRDRVRRQHDDADVSREPGAGAGVAGRATKSSSLSSIITPTSIRGGRWRASAGLTIRSVPIEHGDRRARLGRARARVLAAHEAPGHRRRVERARHDHRRGGGGAPRARRRARCASSTPCTTRRTCSSTSGAIGCDLLVCSPYKFYGPHLGTCTCRKDLLERLDVPKVEPAANIAPGPARDRHVLARGDRGRRGSRRLPRVAGRQRRQPPRGARPHDDGAARARARGRSRDSGRGSAQSPA